MATINNEIVSIGDSLYDITHGYGKVINIVFDEIVVKFKNGLVINFDRDGNYGGVRRLFWHNPVVTEPPKNIDTWEALIKCIQALKLHVK